MSKPKTTLSKSPPPERPIDRRRDLLNRSMLTPLHGQTRGGLCDALLIAMEPPL